MQAEGERNNPIGMQLGVMTGSVTCDVDGLSLSAEELLFSEHLINSVATEVKIKKDGSDNSEYLEPLKKGDLVAVMKMSDSRYFILEKMVKV